MCNGDNDEAKRMAEKIVAISQGRSAIQAWLAK
jgi:hypothetical protein